MTQITKGNQTEMKRQTQKQQQRQEDKEAILMVTVKTETRPQLATVDGKLVKGFKPFPQFEVSLNT